MLGCSGKPTEGRHSKAGALGALGDQTRERWRSRDRGQVGRDQLLPSSSQPFISTKHALHLIVTSLTVGSPVQPTQPQLPTRTLLHPGNPTPCSSSAAS